MGNAGQAMGLYRRALEAPLTGTRGLPETLAWRARHELAALHKAARDYDSALPLWREISTAANEHRLEAIEEMAKYFEHRARDYAQALEAARTGLAGAAPGELPGWQRRVARLEKRLARAPLFQ